MRKTVYDAPKAEAKKSFEDAIALVEERLWRQAAVPEIYDAKKVRNGVRASLLP